MKKNFLIIPFLTIILFSITGCNLVKEEKAVNYQLKPNIIYYVLNDEYLDNDDNNLSKLVMQFTCYNGVKNDIYPYTNTIAIDKVNTIQEARLKLLAEYPQELKLFDNTIVSQNVLIKWKEQGYDGSYSCTDESPKDLNYLNLE